MGIFGSLWNGIKTATAVVAGAAVAAVAAPFYVASKVIDSFSSSSNEVKHSEPAKQVSQQRATTRTSSVQHIDRTAERLSEMREPLMRSARECENSCKQIIEGFFEQYDSQFRNEPSVQGYNLDRLRRKKDSILWDVDGRITSQVSRALSLDDSETKRILRNDDYSERSRQLNRKVDDIQQNALDSMAGTVREGLNSLSQDIERFMQDKVEETEQNIQNQREIFAKWESDLDQKNFDRDQAQLIPAEKLFAIQLIEEKLGA